MTTNASEYMDKVLAAHERRVLSVFDADEVRAIRSKYDSNEENLRKVWYLMGGTMASMERQGASPHESKSALLDLVEDLMQTDSVRDQSLYDLFSAEVSAFANSFYANTDGIFEARDGKDGLKKRPRKKVDGDEAPPSAKRSKPEDPVLSADALPPEVLSLIVQQLGTLPGTTQEKVLDTVTALASGRGTTNDKGMDRVRAIVKGVLLPWIVPVSKAVSQRNVNGLQYRFRHVVIERVADFQSYPDATKVEVRLVATIQNLRFLTPGERSDHNRGLRIHNVSELTQHANWTGNVHFPMATVAFLAIQQGVSPTEVERILPLIHMPNIQTAYVQLMDSLYSNSVASFLDRFPKLGQLSMAGSISNIPIASTTRDRLYKLALGSSGKEIRAVCTTATFKNLKTLALVASFQALDPATERYLTMRVGNFPELEILHAESTPLCWVYLDGNLPNLHRLTSYGPVVARVVQNSPNLRELEMSAKTAEQAKVLVATLTGTGAGAVIHSNSVQVLRIDSGVATSMNLNALKRNLPALNTITITGTLAVTATHTATGPVLAMPQVLPGKPIRRPTIYANLQR